MKEQKDKLQQAGQEAQSLTDEMLANVNGDKTITNEVKSLSEEELDQVNGGISIGTWVRPQMPPIIPCLIDKSKRCNTEGCTIDCERRK